VVAKYAGSVVEPLSEVAHRDCRGSHSELEHVNKPVPNSTPEAAMELLLEKARLGAGAPRREGPGRPSYGPVDGVSS
jgi:hypothetical protein